MLLPEQVKKKNAWVGDEKLALKWSWVDWYCLSKILNSLSRIHFNWFNRITFKFILLTLLFNTPDSSVINLFPPNSRILSFFVTLEYFVWYIIYFVWYIILCQIYYLSLVNTITLFDISFYAKCISFRYVKNRPVVLCMPKHYNTLFKCVTQLSWN